VKVDTDAGITGWGECYTQADRDQSIAAHVQQLGRYLVGRNPMHIKHFTHMAYHDFAGKRGAMDFYSAVSGLEQALWDIVGKYLNTPIYNLLGGPCRERIRVYANGWYEGAKTPDVLAKKAAETVARGFTALKFDPFPGPWRTHIDRKTELAAVENVRAVRESVGPEIDILVEVHRRLAPMHAVRIARLMEASQPFWYEEPVSARSLDELAACKREIHLPVVTGEELYTKAEFRGSSRSRQPTSSTLTCATVAASSSSKRSPRWQSHTWSSSRLIITTAQPSAWRPPCTWQPVCRISSLPSIS
jgi:galactonate dehydratase